jgi:hypothetical protein
MVRSDVIEVQRKQRHAGGATGAVISGRVDGGIESGASRVVFHGRPYGVARDYLRFAIQRAVEAAGSYRNAAQIVNGERRNLLYFMAGIKNRHAISLKINDPESGSSILENGDGEKGASVTSYFLDVEFKPLDSLDEVFLFIFKNEQKNLSIYTRLSQLERDPEVRTLFLYLIQLQTSDIFRLESEFAKLSKAETPATDGVGSNKGAFASKS